MNTHQKCNDYIISYVKNKKYKTDTALYWKQCFINEIKKFLVK